MCHQWAQSGGGAGTGVSDCSPLGSIVITRLLPMSDIMLAKYNAPAPVLVPSSMSTSGFTFHRISCTNQHRRIKSSVLARNVQDVLGQGENRKTACILQAQALVLPPLVRRYSSPSPATPTIRLTAMSIFADSLVLPKIENVCGLLKDRAVSIPRTEVLWRCRTGLG